jgi:hypothetical protein
MSSDSAIVGIVVAAGFALGVLLLVVLTRGDAGSRDRVGVRLAADRKDDGAPGRTLRFSNTQAWGSKEKALRDRYGDAHRALAALIPDMPPPPNDSDRTQTELRALHRMSAQRTAARQRAIEAEKSDLRGVLLSWPGVTDEDAQTLVRFDYETVGPLVMHLKDKYDRVRPSYLDPSLSTSIAVPQHPSYPSGHATQIHAIAHFLSAKHPHHRDAYFRRAHDVAVNREHAGLHYKSDSTYGQEIAAALAGAVPNPLLVQ